MTFNNINPSSNGITGGTGSKITVGHTGVYNIQFSAQFDKTDEGRDNCNIWLSVGGTEVTGTNRNTILASSDSNDLICSWNYIQSLNANEYVELSWHSIDTAMRISAIGATAYNTVQIPSTPSVIATINSITNS